MIPIDLINADVAGYQIFYFTLILTSVYLICYNYFQSSVKQRIRIFRLMKLMFYLIIMPLYLLWMVIAVRQYIHDDLHNFVLDRVYWKVVTMFVMLLIITILFVFLFPGVNKGIKFLKKKDRNEVRYQSIFKKTRTIIIVLLFIDIAMVMFMNKVVG